MKAAAFAGWALALTLAAGTTQASQPPEWRWRQILSIPNIGGRLRAVAVDPADSDRIFVGTEEGTVLRSTDGGISWDEIELGPFIIRDREYRLTPPGLPELGEVAESNFFVFVDPPNQEFVDRIPIPSASDPFPIRPEFFFAGFLATSPSAPRDLLFSVAESRRGLTIPVRRIVICPGTAYPLLVATKRELYGSFDDGLTYVRLFANPGHTNIDNVECAVDDPRHVALATQIGLFTSTDGGLAFDQDLSAWPGQRASAVAFGPRRPDGSEYLLSAAESELFGGDPHSAVGLSFVYPNNDPETAPWETINWIDSTQDGEIWLATDDGLRASFDGGASWETIARTLLNRQSLWQVEIGQSESGGRRVAVMLNQQVESANGDPVGGLQDSMVYASDDRGETWHPFFNGLSRRSFQMMEFAPPVGDRPAAWYVLTSGGLWTTAPFRNNVSEGTGLSEARWAKERLRSTPDLYSVMTEVLEHTRLSNERIEELADMHRALNYVPRIDLYFELNTGGFAQTGQRITIGLDPLSGPGTCIAPCDEDTNRNAFRFFAQLSWDVKDIIRLAEDIPPVRTALHELRRQIGFATEDAWHERVRHLKLLASGIEDPVKVGALKTRVEALEAILEVWMGHSLSEMKKG